MKSSKLVSSPKTQSWSSEVHAPRLPFWSNFQNKLLIWTQPASCTSIEWSSFWLCTSTATSSSKTNTAWKLCFTPGSFTPSSRLLLKPTITWYFLSDTDEISHNWQHRKQVRSELRSIAAERFQGPDLPGRLQKSNLGVKQFIAVQKIFFGKGEWVPFHTELVVQQEQAVRVHISKHQLKSAKRIRVRVNPWNMENQTLHSQDEMRACRLRQLKLILSFMSGLRAVQASLQVQSPGRNRQRNHHPECGTFRVRNWQDYLQDGKILHLPHEYQLHDGQREQKSR